MDPDEAANRGDLLHLASLLLVKLLLKLFQVFPQPLCVGGADHAGYQAAQTCNPRFKLFALR